jgi:hypothetical protein
MLLRLHYSHAYEAPGLASIPHHLDLQGSIAGSRPQLSGRASTLHGVRNWLGARGVSS